MIGTSFHPHVLGELLHLIVASSLAMGTFYLLVLVLVLTTSFKVYERKRIFVREVVFTRLDVRYRY